MIHVYPLNDLREHELDGTSCECGVRVEWEHAEALVIHASFDGREHLEMQVRTLNDHRVNECNEANLITVLDAPGDGGANHVYGITLVKDGAPTTETTIKFQKGPIKEAGVNGLTNEVLLAIVIDRLRGFQSGKFSCRENALALTKIEEAMHWLHSRTRARVERGVEGTTKP